MFYQEAKSVEGNVLTPLQNQSGCSNDAKNSARCTCTYEGCPRHGLCCECLQYHLKSKQLPACCFPPEVERSYDRSFKCFIKTWS